MRSDGAVSPFLPFAVAVVQRHADTQRAVFDVALPSSFSVESCFPRFTIAGLILRKYGRIVVGAIELLSLFGGLVVAGAAV